MSHDKDKSWAEELGKIYADDIARMVEALESPFTSENTSAAELAEAWAEATGEDESAYNGSEEQRAAAFEHLNADKRSRGWSDRAEEALEAIQEAALSVAVRPDWTSLDEKMTPTEFLVLLTTGGPAVRIRGELDRHGEPDRAWLEVQDWGKPWTEYLGPNPAALADACLAYARCFCWEVCR